ncbi:MAG: nitrate transporter ATP-binding protein [Actinotalea sp.]|nr:nitrate transporter ATP-binding protein [Actinotalea sp.]
MDASHMSSREGFTAATGVDDRAAAVATAERAEPPYLEVDRVSIRFTSKAGGKMQETSVLEELSFSLRKGEFCCIVGPSGCGKSTSLRIIDGLQAASSGEVRIEGAVVTEPRPDIAFVFQGFNLLPWRSLLDNVAFGLDNLGISKQERAERATKWLSTVGLADFAQYYPSQVSGGMQQRVGLARALAVEPRLLLMDEPFGAVDAQTRMLLQNEVLRLWEAEQKTVVFVTHDIEEALFLADRVLIMGPRPSRVLREVVVPFARPREDHIRGDSEFAALKDEIWTELKAAMAEPTAGAEAAR